MAKILYLMLIVLLPGLASGQMLSKIAAVVNQDIITTNDLESNLEKALEKAGYVPPEKIEKIRAQILEEKIGERLLKQKIVELGLTASDEEVDQTIKDVQRQNQIDDEQLKGALAAQGLDWESYRNKLRDQILHFKLLGREVQSKIEVTNQDVRDYFREHIDDYRDPASVHLIYLLFPLAAGQEQNQRELATGVRNRLLEGEEFASVLVELTQAGVAQGGELGTFKVPELSTKVAEALADSQKGTYSDLIETDAGLMLVRVEKRTPGKIRKYDQVKVDIRQRLTDEGKKKRLKEWTTQLKKDAYIDIRI